MAYSETISTQKYPSSSSTRYCRFELDLSCDSIVSQTGYVDLNYKLKFYSRGSGSYGSTVFYQANNVVFSVNGETLFSGTGPYVPSGMIYSNITLDEGTFRALLDENGKPHFDLSITAVLKLGEGGSPIDYSYTQSKTLSVGDSLYYSNQNSNPEYNFQSDAYATWTLQTQNILENSSQLKLQFQTTDQSSHEVIYYARITALNGPQSGEVKTLTLRGGDYRSSEATLDIFHPTSTSEVARFQMEVGAQLQGGGGRYSTPVKPATTAKYTLPRIFRNIAEIYVGDSFKTARVYVYKNGTWKRAQPYVFTDGSYVSA